MARRTEAALDSCSASQTHSESHSGARKSRLGGFTMNRPPRSTMSEHPLIQTALSKQIEVAERIELAEIGSPRMSPGRESSPDRVLLLCRSGSLMIRPWANARQRLTSASALSLTGPTHELGLRAAVACA
jgi:hypothetical protein